jgi:hypothetical protein
MEIELTGVEGRNALYWRARAEESRDTARQMSESAPRRGMLEIARIYDMLATRAGPDAAPQSSTR